MPCIDSADPRQVFDRLAQIHHDTEKRIATIDALTLAQAERIASPTTSSGSGATWNPRPTRSSAATAYDEQHYIRHSVDYCLTIIDGSVMVKPHVNACDLGDLTEEEIAAALEGSE